MTAYQSTADDSTGQTTTHTCDRCGEDFEIPAHFNDPDQPLCDDCFDARERRGLVEAVQNPDSSDTRFSRPRAIQRLEREDSLPVTDHDGSLILDAEVAYGSGRGCEPDGRYLEEVVKVVSRDCESDHCDGSTMLVRHRQIAASMHESTFTCQKCGQVTAEGSY